MPRRAALTACDAMATVSPAHAARSSSATSSLFIASSAVVTRAAGAGSGSDISPASPGRSRQPLRGPVAKIEPIGRRNPSWEL